MSFKDNWNNYWSNAFSSWDNYHKYGIIPNLWAGFTGQKSVEQQTEANIAASNEQFDKNLDFLSQQHQDEMAFQAMQFQGQMDLANSNLALNRDIAKQNFNLQKQAFNYQKQLNATQMEREDTAIQRQIADAQAAGLSPLSVLGGSGSSSTPLSSGSAPQMDISGVNSAVGQYVDIARQYASLHAQATQNYMNGRSNAAMAHNSQILGARTALNQMKADMHYKGQNMATQYFNAAVNASNARLQRDYMREQIKTKRFENSWYDEHGYNQLSLATVLSDFLKRDSTKNAMESIASMGDKFTSAVSDVVNALHHKSDSALVGSLSEFKESLSKSGFSESEQKILIDALEAEAKKPLSKIAIKELDGFLNRIYWKLAKIFHK